MTFISGSELIEAFRGRGATTDCASELAAYRRARKAAQSRPRPDQCSLDMNPAAAMEASQMQKVWWKWWQGSARPESISITMAFQNTPSTLVAECITRLMEKHAILSSRFVESEGRLSVYINDASRFQVDNLATFNSPAEALQSYENWRKTPIPHDGDWLVRAAVAMVHDDAIAALEISHLICDGYSLNLLEEDLRQMVTRYKTDNADEPKRDFSFFKYAIAEREWYQSGDSAELRSYWARRVDCSPLFSSPGGTPVGGRISGPRTRFQIALAPDLTQRILSLGKKIQTTPYTLFLSFYALALSDWSNCARFYISSVYDLRSTPELISTVGYLTTTRLTEISFKDTLDVRTAINHVWLQEQFSRSIPLPPGASDDPSIRNGVSALLNYMPASQKPRQLPVEPPQESPCVISEPVITEPRPAGHPISLLLRGKPDGGIRGALDFGGEHLRLDEMWSLANALKARLTLHV